MTLMKVKRMTQRLTDLCLVMLGISFLTFLLYFFAPGDKAQAIAQAQYGGEAGVPAEVIEMIRVQYKLDESFIEQFVHWLSSFVQGDFGLSFISQEAVWGVVQPNLMATLTLALSALLIGLSLAFLLSIISVRYQGSLIDRFTIMLASIGAAVPSYWLGLLLILVFSAWLQWLPSYGSGSLAHMILPATTLALWVTTSQVRLLRSFLLEALAAPHLEALRLRRVSEREIFWRHVLRHAAVPAFTMIGIEMVALLEGTVMIEIIFSRHGIGSLFVHSVMSRDYPVMMFLVMFSALCYVIINTLIEWFQDWINPAHLQHRTHT